MQDGIYAEEEICEIVAAQIHALNKESLAYNIGEYLRRKKGKKMKNMLEEAARSMKEWEVKKNYEWYSVYSRE